MQRVTCPKRYSGWKVCINSYQPFDDALRNWQPTKCPVLRIILELLKDQRQVCLRNGRFSQFPMHRRHAFGATMDRTGHLICCGETSDLFPALIFKVQTNKVRRVEIDQSGRSSRSSEIPIVQSVPPRSFPSFDSFANARETFRRAKYGTSA